MCSIVLLNGSLFLFHTIQYLLWNDMSFFLAYRKSHFSYSMAHILYIDLAECIIDRVVSFIFLLNGALNFVRLYLCIIFFILLISWWYRALVSVYIIHNTYYYRMNEWKIEKSFFCLAFDWMQGKYFWKLMV